MFAVASKASVVLHLSFAVLAVRPLIPSPMPPGVRSWGPRTMLCYWINNHLAKVEQITANWFPMAETTLRQYYAPDQKKAGTQVSCRNTVTPGYDVKARDLVNQHMAGGVWPPLEA